MLQKIRDRISGWFATVFLGAIALVFVFWGIKFEWRCHERPRRGSTAKASRSTSVRRAWQERQAELQREMRDELPAELVKSEQRALLDEFVRRELLRQRASDLGYRVSDQKLVRHAQLDSGTSGRRQVLARPVCSAAAAAGPHRGQFEADLREDLQIGELQRGIAVSSFVTPAELRRRTELEGEQRDVDFVRGSVLGVRASRGSGGRGRGTVVRGKQVALHDSRDGRAAVR